MPSFKKTLFACNNFLHLSLSLFKDFSGFFSLFFLRDDLSSKNIFLFFQSFALLVHWIDKKILFLFDFLEIGDIILSSESLYFSDSNIRFELNIVCLNLMIMSHEIFQLFLCFGDFSFEDVGLLFFGVVDLIDLVKFLFWFYSESLCDIVIIMGFFVIHLISSQLLLCCVKTDTDFLFTFLNIFLFDFSLLKFQFKSLFFLQKLFIEEILHGSIKWIISC